MTENTIAGTVTKSIELNDSDIEKINQYSLKELTKDDVFIFKVVLCNNEIDRDFECFSTEALNGLANLFIGKTGISDHSFKAEDQKARIFETAVEFVDGKTTSYGEPFAQLTAKAYILRCEKNECLIGEIEAGIKKEVSVSCSMRKTTCSICSGTGRCCEHRPGQVYDGVLCYRTLDEPYDAYEFSFVAVPAQREAGVFKNAKLTQEQENKQQEEQEAPPPIQEKKSLVDGLLEALFNLSKKYKNEGE